MLCLYQTELNLGAPNHEGNGIHARRVARARRSTTSVHQRMEGPGRGLQFAVRSSRQRSSRPEYVGPHSVLLICSMEEHGSGGSHAKRPSCQGRNQKARGIMHGGHPGGVSRRRRIALAEHTEKRIPTRVMWQCSILTSRSTRRRCALSEIRRFWHLEAHECFPDLEQRRG